MNPLNRVIGAALLAAAPAGAAVAQDSALRVAIRFTEAAQSTLAGDRAIIAARYGTGKEERLEIEPHDQIVELRSGDQATDVSVEVSSGRRLSGVSLLDCVGLDAPVQSLAKRTPTILCSLTGQ